MFTFPFSLCLFHHRWPLIAFPDLSPFFPFLRWRNQNRKKKAFLSFCSNFALPAFFFFFSPPTFIQAFVALWHLEADLLRLMGLCLCLSECQRYKSVLKENWESEVIDGTPPEGSIHTHFKTFGWAVKTNNCLPRVLCVHCLVWGTFRRQETCS